MIFNVASLRGISHTQSIYLYRYMGNCLSTSRPTFIAALQKHPSMHEYTIIIILVVVVVVVVVFVVVVVIMLIVQQLLCTRV